MPRYKHAVLLHECYLTLCFVLSAMDGKIKQCVCIKFCVKLGKSTTETLEILREASGEHALSRRADFELHSRFNASRVPVADNKHLGQPSINKTTENVEKI
jgi:hypothetical protein